MNFIVEGVVSVTISFKQYLESSDLIVDLCLAWPSTFLASEQTRKFSRRKQKSDGSGADRLQQQQLMVTAVMVMAR